MVVVSGVIPRVRQPRFIFRINAWVPAKPLLYLFKDR